MLGHRATIAVTAVLLAGVAYVGFYVTGDYNVGWALSLAVLCFGALIKRYDDE